MQAQSVEWPVLAGLIPAVPDPYVPRRETGLSPAGLPMVGTTVLVPAEDSTSGLGALGGTGKTSLAAALAHASLEEQTARLVVWITATGRDAVISGYANALRELGQVPTRGRDPELAAGQFLDWLAHTDVPWLVVLDNLAAPAVADGLWPTGAKGRVLVTTCRPDAAASAYSPHAVRVGAYNPREALAYLSARLEQGDPGQRSGAVELVTELGFSPAALGLASAFIAATGMDCRDYRARFAERRQALARVFPDGLSSALAATWTLSCELADQFPPRGMAWRALALLSMLAPDGIPGAVLASHAARAYLAGAHGPAAGGADVRPVVYNLARAGLVTISDQSPARTVLVHQAVQALTRKYLPAEQARGAAQAAADALAETWEGPRLNPPVTQALRDCTVKLQKIAGTFLWTSHCHPALLAAGQSLDSEGLAGAAVLYWQAMLGASRKILGDQHPQTTRIHGLFGAACEASGDHQTAISAYEAALDERAASAGTADPGSRDIRDRLIRTYLAAGRTDDALHLAEAAFQHCEQNLGPDHTDTLAAHASLADAFLRAGQPRNAATALRDVVTRREQLLGPNHPDTIAARLSLAGVYRASGRFKEAIALGKRALAERERSQGAGHPDTVAARAILASVYRSANKHKDALRLYERVLADRERALGAGHPDTILARSDVALESLATRKFAVAIAQYERALDDSRRALGDNHPMTKSARQSLDEAGAYARSILGIELRSPGQPRRA